MLKEIISITGKPGLYKILSSQKSMLIVESLVDKKRMPSHPREKVVALGDIAIFSDSGEVRLGDVFEKMKEKENGAAASVDPNAEAENLQTYFAEILPDYDRNRVYPSNIKKIISWYNLLIQNDLTDFAEKKEEEA